MYSDKPKTSHINIRLPHLNPESKYYKGFYVRVLLTPFDGIRETFVSFE